MPGAPNEIRDSRKTPIPTRPQPHMMNRMGCGYPRSTWAQMKRAGGATRWSTKQLNYPHVSESRKARELLDWFPDLRDSASRKWVRQQNKSKAGWE